MSQHQANEQSQQAAPTAVETQDYNPLMGNTVERSYTGANVNPDDIPERVPEPTFTAPSMDVESAAQGPASPDQPAAQFNPHVQDLPNKEKKEASAKLAQVLIDGYGWGLTAMGSIAKIPERKLEKEFREGTIDERLQLPVDSMGNTVSVRDFTSEFNGTIDDAVAIDQEFRDTVTPPLERVLMKHGAGVTDEQMLLIYFGKDFAAKSITLFQLRRESRRMVEALRDASAANRPAAKQVIPDAPAHVAAEPEIQPAQAKTEAAPLKVVEDSSEKLGFNTPHVPANGSPDFGNKDRLNHMEETFGDKVPDSKGRPDGTTSVKRKPSTNKK